MIKVLRYFYLNKGCLNDDFGTVKYFKYTSYQVVINGTNQYVTGNAKKNIRYVHAITNILFDFTYRKYERNANEVFIPYIQNTWIFV